MSTNQNDIIHSKVLTERNQDLDTRKHLYDTIENCIGMPVISYMTSFHFPVMIDDSDAEILEQVLRASNLKKGFALLISSPGGDPLAAERIINLCRGNSKTNAFTSIVPGKAKSAATIICMGSSEIWMGVGSELGPIDPQIITREDGKTAIFSANTIIRSYNALFEKATKEQGHIEPYLQQLSHYDERAVYDYKVAVDLSSSIAAKYLKSGMMNSLSDEEINKKIAIFIDPDYTKNHGRPIYRDGAKEAGLSIKHNNDILCWDAIYELYVRLNMFVSDVSSKCVESRDVSFCVRAPT